MDEDAQLKELDYTALKTLQFVVGLQDPSLREMDNTDMEESHEIHAVQKKKVKRRSYRRKKSQCKKVVTFAAENARTYLDVTIRGRSLRFQLDTGADITLISRRTWKKIGRPTLETCIMPVKTADGTPMKIDGRFSTDFSIRDHATSKIIQGNGTCYVAESTNLLGLEWSIQLPAYKELKEKYTVVW
ncbi:hypothetical protein ANCDUO_23655 [Ancylostoma duodenale]|uniref:Peptidase A2 domain-containing protein n=1 Tax=Ancylostoma duodenale TaxID=51022 RepID=A0A0C2BR86_9BILA|nr:hypothetical protein ANCDUO_23655 [Ancylostoma duodenale]